MKSKLTLRLDEELIKEAKQSAFHSKLDGILTRNKQDFKKSQLPVYTPQELIALLKR